MEFSLQPIWIGLIQFVLDMLLNEKESMGMATAFVVVVVVVCFCYFLTHFQRYYHLSLDVDLLIVSL
jgi:hypothetical protein